MRLMHSSFDFLLRKANMTNVKTSLVDIRRGLFRTMPHMKRQLNNFTETNPDEKRFVVFNTGLHDIDRLCSGRMWAARQRDEEIMNKTIPKGSHVSKHIGSSLKRWCSSSGSILLSSRCLDRRRRVG